MSVNLYFTEDTSCAQGQEIQKLVTNRMDYRSCMYCCTSFLSVSDGDLNLYTGFDGDGSDLLDDLGGGVKVDHPLVDPQLEPVPGLGGHPHGALDLQLLLLGSLDQVGADLLQALNGAGGQGDPDPVDHLLLAGATFTILVSRHDLFVSDRVMLG